MSPFAGRWKPSRDCRAALAGCEALAVRELAGQISGAPELAAKLALALVEDPPPVAREGGAIRAGYDAELDGIAEASRTAREWIGALEASERRRTGIRSLKVGFNKVFGYYIEVSNANTTPPPADYVRKQTLTGAERYLTPELKEKEAIVLTAQERIAERELEILRELGAAVAESASILRSSAHAIGMIDALCSAWPSPRQSLAGAGRRSTPVCGSASRAAGTRWSNTALPAGVFVPNDLELDPDRDQIVILTGPNMAGKSTYLRQAAVIVLLAQCGSFVPAESAVVGLADRIFTRVGAHDDITAGMSTFMVEMTETANILNHATRSSLVIFDEVGRGTSTYDGVSIAQAVVEHLHDSPKLGCRTLFATHYHELTALAERLPRVVATSASRCSKMARPSASCTVWCRAARTDRMESTSPRSPGFPQESSRGRARCSRSWSASDHSSRPSCSSACRSSWLPTRCARSSRTSSPTR